MNTKKAELAKLKHQIESYQNEQPTIGNGKFKFFFLKINSNVSGNQPYADSHSRSTSSIHSTTLNDIEHRTNKRRRDHMSDTDTSGDEEIQEVNKIIDLSIDFYLLNKDFNTKSINYTIEIKSC